MPQLIDEIIAFVDDVLDEINARREVESLRDILRNGTSADRQLATYYQAMDDGCTPEQAMRLVMDRLIGETNQYGG
jgi:carboxylate-amine ligase